MGLGPKRIEAADEAKPGGAADGVGCEDLSIPPSSLGPRGNVVIGKNPNAMLLCFRFRAPDRPYSLWTSTWR